MGDGGHMSSPVPERVPDLQCFHDSFEVNLKSVSNLSAVLGYIWRWAVHLVRFQLWKTVFSWFSIFHIQRFPPVTPVTAFNPPL